MTEASKQYVEKGGPPKKQQQQQMQQQSRDGGGRGGKANGTPRQAAEVQGRRSGGNMERGPITYRQKRQQRQKMEKKNKNNRNHQLQQQRKQRNGTTTIVSSQQTPMFGNVPVYRPPSRHRPRRPPKTASGVTRRRKMTTSKRLKSTCLFFSFFSFCFLCWGGLDHHVLVLPTDQMSTNQTSYNILLFFSLFFSSLCNTGGVRNFSLF